MKHRANRRRMSNKKFIAILSVFVMLALTMVVGCAVDGTVAWLVSESESSVSTSGREGREHGSRPRRCQVPLCRQHRRK